MNDKPIDMQQALHEGILEALKVLREAHIQYRGSYPLPQNPDYAAMQLADAALAAGGPVVPITGDMVREALAHVPVALKPVDRWEWLAEFLNRARAHPDVPCECCGVTPAGDTTDRPTNGSYKD